MSIIKEFREFAVQGNVVDTAVGFVIGGVFTPIASSLVNDIIMPVIGLLTGRVDFKNLYVLLQQGAAAPAPYESLEAAKAAGAVTINYGSFLNIVITFLITAFAVFLLVKGMNKLRKEKKAEEAAASA